MYYAWTIVLLAAQIITDEIEAFCLCHKMRFGGFEMTDQGS